MNNSLNSLQTVYPATVAQKGKEVYQKLIPQLEPVHTGEFMAIEVESGEYFLGKTQIESLALAKKKFPTKIFYMVKVGYPAVITVSTHSRSPLYGNIL